MPRSYSAVKQSGSIQKILKYLQIKNTDYWYKNFFRQFALKGCQILNITIIWQVFEWLSIVQVAI